VQAALDENRRGCHATSAVRQNFDHHFTADPSRPAALLLARTASDGARSC
jgi:hypothetical protein